MKTKRFIITNNVSIKTDLSKQSKEQNKSLNSLKCHFMQERKGSSQKKPVRSNSFVVFKHTALK